mgnify:CR=1 FL=1
MKEATGEANMTVVTIILIAVIVAIATPIVNSMMNNTEKKACCMSNGGTWKQGGCKGASDVCTNTEDKTKQIEV